MKQVKKEWQHPIHRNSFGIPFLNLVLLSWMAAKWPGARGSGELAEVLFWMGTVPLASLTFFTIARFDVLAASYQLYRGSAHMPDLQSRSVAARRRV